MSRLKYLNETCRTHLAAQPPRIYQGKITALKGPILSAELPSIALNDICTIQTRNGSTIEAQAIGFQGETVTLAPLDELRGVCPGSTVTHTGTALTVKIPCSTGTVIDARGKLLMDLSTGKANHADIEVEREAPTPLERTPISKQLATGITSIDLFCPLGYGQRIGLFAGPGAGKSTLLGMIAKHAQVDVCVIALVGERGREVRDFIDEALGEVGLARSIVVVSTSDEPPLRRRLAVQTATSIAEYHRDRGKKVLLLVDSLTRVARAIRDVNLTAGEFPVRHGYTPSVYTELPRLVERTGNNSKGSITAIYSILTSGPAETDPLAEELKGLLDGHLVLDAGIASWGVRPAIDITISLSRLREKLLSQQDRLNAASVSRLVQRLFSDKDTLLLGGTPDAELQQALENEAAIVKLLHQDSDEHRELVESKHLLEKLTALKGVN